MKRMASQSTLSRFFGGFDGTATNLRSFRALWHYALRAGYPRGAAVTRSISGGTPLVHEDGKQEGVKVGYSRKRLEAVPQTD